jgi:hypothetical protein
VRRVFAFSRFRADAARGCVSRSELPRRGLADREVAAAGKHVHAQAGELGGGLPAKAAVGAGDQRDPVK